MMTNEIIENEDHEVIDLMSDLLGRKFYIAFNDSNGSLARYDTAVHGQDAIPASAIEVDEALFFRTINDSSVQWAIVDGVIIEQPLPEPAPRLKRYYTPLEFLDRFSDQEQLAVVTATMSNPAIKLWYDKLIAATYVDLTDARTESGVDALIAAELIEASRREALLAPDPL